VGFGGGPCITVEPRRYSSDLGDVARPLAFCPWAYGLGFPITGYPDPCHPR